MRKLFTLLLTVVMVSAIGSISAFGEDYLSQVKKNYPSIFVIRVTTSRIVRSTDGTDCFFKYESEFVESLRGKFRNRNVTFYSQLGLTVGDEYLVLFSEPDALVHRIDPGTPLTAPGGECERKIDGYLLLYNELHHISRVWTGKTLVTAVEFNDAFADFPPEHQIIQRRTLMPLSDIRSSLTQ